jgi:hypothetical protein
VRMKGLEGNTRRGVLGGLYGSNDGGDDGLTEPALSEGENSLRSGRQRSPGDEGTSRSHKSGGP